MDYARPGAAILAAGLMLGACGSSSSSSSSSTTKSSGGNTTALALSITEPHAGSDAGGDWPAFAKRLRRVYADAIRLELARGVMPPSGRSNTFVTVV